MILKKKRESFAAFSQDAYICTVKSLQTVMAIHKIKFFAGRGSRYLAEKIVARYGTKLGESEVLNFSDGEFQPCFLESIRGCTVFVIQSTFPPTDNLMELLMMIDAAKRA